MIFNQVPSLPKNVKTLVNIFIAGSAEPPLNEIIRKISGRKSTGRQRKQY